MACGFFYREAGGGGANPTGSLPFTVTLRHGERVSSLLDRLRSRLCGRNVVFGAEAWRLARFHGPIPPPTNNTKHHNHHPHPLLHPYVPSQESFTRMRTAYKYLPSGGRIDLADFGFPPSSATFRLGRNMLLFGMRPWLGVEIPVVNTCNNNNSRLSPTGGAALLAGSLQNFGNGGVGVNQLLLPSPVGTGKRRQQPGGGRYVLSEKPIRILN